MNETYSACGDHQCLARMEFYRALEIARECPFCYVEPAKGDGIIF